MKLFVWKEALTDWTHGVIFALATDVDAARKQIIDDIAEDWEKEAVRYEINKEPEVYTKPFSFVLWGGG